MSRMTPAYVAGLIDGEGCIAIFESKNRTYYHSVTVGMTSKALPILDQLKQKYGGTMTKTREATERWDAAHAWAVFGDEATSVLREIQPHLVLKEEQARIALKVAEIKASLPARWTKPDADQRARKWTEEASDRCAILKRRMHELNAKGPQEPTTRSPDGRSPIARLVAGVWVTDQSDLLSDLGWEQFSGTWPKSGSMRTGRLYPRPAWVPPTGVSVGSVLPTPRASRGASSTETVALLPSPRTSDTNGAGHHGDGGMDLRTAVAEIPLLPTPAAKEPGGTPPEQYRARWVKSDGRESTFLPLSMTVRLLPTPRATDGTKGGPNQRGSSGVNLLQTPCVADGTGGRARRGGERGEELLLKGQAEVMHGSRWGEYEPAIRRWESVTRPAPEPTKPNGKGNPKLSDEFDEWLMGYPAGWITDVPGVTWNEALKACGNGVVPQQGAAAVRWLLTMGGAA